MSFLDKISQFPNYFTRNDIGFVVCAGGINNEMRIEAADHVRDHLPGIARAIDFYNWDLREIFYSWTNEDMAKLNNRIICFHVGEGRGVLRSAHRVKHRFTGVVEGNAGHFYTERLEGEIGLVNIPIGGFARCDGDLRDVILHIYDNRGCGIFKADEFSSLLLGQRDQ